MSNSVSISSVLIVSRPLKIFDTIVHVGSYLLQLQLAKKYILQTEATTFICLSSPWFVYGILLGYTGQNFVDIHKLDKWLYISPPKQMLGKRNFVVYMSHIIFEMIYVPREIQTTHCSSLYQFGRIFLTKDHRPNQILVLVGRLHTIFKFRSNNVYIQAENHGWQKTTKCWAVVLRLASFQACSWEIRLDDTLNSRRHKWTRWTWKVLY